SKQYFRHGASASNYCEARYEFLSCKNKANQPDRFSRFFAEFGRTLVHLVSAKDDLKIGAIQ
ncbi:MAG: hypothetical protein ACPHUG_09620, partial [Porticoccaceae bacterium]